MSKAKISEAQLPSKNAAEAGRRWGILHRFLIGDGKDVYLDRLSLVTTPWFSVKLHRIYRPDRQRDLHDHPWNFLSILLRGKYLEDTPSGPRIRRWWNFKRAEDAHRIMDITRSPVWTLVFCGRRRRGWGFWKVSHFDPPIWIPWNEYEKLNQP